MNLEQFRAQQRPERRVCRHACGRRTAQHTDVTHVYEDGSVRPFPPCDRCWALGTGCRPFPDEDGIDAMVRELARQQTERIRGFMAAGKWPPSGSRRE